MYRAETSSEQLSNQGNFTPSGFLETFCLSRGQNRTIYLERLEQGERGFFCRPKGYSQPWTPPKCRWPPPPDPPRRRPASRRCQRGPSLFPRLRLEVRAPARGGAGPAARHVAAAPGAHPASVRQQRALRRRRRQRCGGRGRGGQRLDPRGNAPAPGR